MKFISLSLVMVVIFALVWFMADWIYPIPNGGHYVIYVREIWLMWAASIIIPYFQDKLMKL